VAPPFPDEAKGLKLGRPGIRRAERVARAFRLASSHEAAGRFVYCSPKLASRWFGKGRRLERGELMDLDRSGALNVVAGNPTTRMPHGFAAGFLQNRLPFTTFGNRRVARQPIWRAMPARLGCLRLGVARNRRLDGTFSALGLDLIVQILNCNPVLLTGFFGMNFNWLTASIASGEAFLILGVLLPLLGIVWLWRRDVIRFRL
jgi:hypothetical protein